MLCSCHNFAEVSGSITGCRDGSSSSLPRVYASTLIRDCIQTSVVVVVLAVVIIVVSGSGSGSGSRRRSSSRRRRRASRVAVAVVVVVLPVVGVVVGVVVEVVVEVELELEAKVEASAGVIVVVVVVVVVTATAAATAPAGGWTHPLSLPMPNKTYMPKRTIPPNQIHFKQERECREARQFCSQGSIIDFATSFCCLFSSFS